MWCIFLFPERSWCTPSTWELSSILGSSEPLSCLIFLLFFSWNFITISRFLNLSSIDLSIFLNIFHLLIYVQFYSFFHQSFNSLFFYSKSTLFTLLVAFLKLQFLQVLLFSKHSFFGLFSKLPVLFYISTLCTQILLFNAFSDSFISLVSACLSFLTIHGEKLISKGVQCSLGCGRILQSNLWVSHI